MGGIDFKTFKFDHVNINTRRQVGSTIKPLLYSLAIEDAGFTIKRAFADGFWDVPYVRFVPRQIQKLFFGSLGGLQAITGIVFLPRTWGESIIVIAQKE